MEITIHRGASEIGGSCVQITSADRSILIDAGSPLGESKADVDLSKLSFDAIFISHPHKDHFGLIEGLDPEKPVYIGQIARELLDATRIFIGLEPLQNTFRPLHNRQWIELDSDFRVMPYLMDHSCVDAFGFLIEAVGKRIYYSGDFRAHGRRKKAFEWFINDPPRDIDLLLMEGTMMGRDNHAYPNEEAVEAGMLEVLRNLDDQACFLICSGQHIDRICAAYRACLRAKRIFVTDIYTAYILRIVARRFRSLPDINTAQSIKVLTKGVTARAHYAKIADHRDSFGTFARDIFQPETMIDIAEIVAQPSRYFLKISNFSDLLERLNPCGVIYSMWSGYLEEPKYQGIKQHPLVAFHEIHTSGHAVRDDLHRLVTALRPQRLVPIHTEYPEAYDVFKNVVRLKDGDTLQL